MAKKKDGLREKPSMDLYPTEESEKAVEFLKNYKSPNEKTDSKTKTPLLERCNECILIIKEMRGQSETYKRCYEINKDKEKAPTPEPTLPPDENRTKNKCKCGHFHFTWGLEKCVELDCPCKTFTPIEAKEPRENENFIFKISVNKEKIPSHDEIIAHIKNPLEPWGDEKKLLAPRPELSEAFKMTVKAIKHKSAMEAIEFESFQSFNDYKNELVKSVEHRVKMEIIKKFKDCVSEWRLSLQGFQGEWVNVENLNEVIKKELGMR